MEPAPRPSEEVAPEMMLAAEDARALQLALERVCFDEWRLEQQATALADKDRVIQEQRLELAGSAQRAEAAARRALELEGELSRTRAEIVTLGDRSAQAGELCSELEQRLEQLERRASQAELQLERERSNSRSMQTALQRSRERTSVLERGRERFFARLVEWQRLGAASNPDQVDLAQFIAELRAEIASLSTENQSLQERLESLLVAGAAAAPRAATEDPEASDPEQLRGEVFHLDQIQPEELFDEELAAAAVAPEPPPLRARPVAAAAPPGPVQRAGLTAPRRSLQESAPERAEAISGSGRVDAELALPGSAAAPASDDGAPVDRDQIEQALLAGVAGDPQRRYARRLMSELFAAGKLLRNRAAAALVELAGKNAAPALIAALRGVADPAARAELLAHIGSAGHPCALVVIESHRRDADPLLRSAALEASLRLLRGDPQALRQALRGSLQDPDVRVRRRAVVAATACAGVDLHDVLVPLLRDADPHIRRVACAALANDTSPATQRALLAVLLDADAGVRRAAARVLEPRVGRSLAAIVGGPESERRRAVTALRKRVLVESRAVEEAAEARASEAMRLSSSRREALRTARLRIAARDPRAAGVRIPAAREAPWKR